MLVRGVAQKRADFRALHQSGCFVLPNPWDAGSAKLLSGLGFKALATTSSGHAWSCAQADGQLSRSETLAVEFHPKLSHFRSEFPSKFEPPSAMFRSSPELSRTEIDGSFFDEKSGSIFCRNRQTGSLEAFDDAMGQLKVAESRLGDPEISRLVMRYERSLSGEVIDAEEESEDGAAAELVGD